MLLRPFLALLAAAAAAPSPALQSPAAETSPSRPGAELRRHVGLYEFGGDRFVTISWLDEIGGLVAIDYPAGRIRALHPQSSSSFTTGPTAVADEPVEARIVFVGDRLVWTEKGRDSTARLAAFRESEVTIDARTHRLAGTLTLPRGKGPFPAVVLLHGGGAQDRNFLWVAPFFARSGVAVLAYDKRGVGGSGGDWRGATGTDLATDALAAIDFLRGRRDIDRGRIGLYGSSNGGWVAPIAATLAPDKVAFIAARAASGLPERKNIVYEVEGDLRQAGYGDEVVARSRALHIRDIGLIRSGGAGWNEFRAELAAAAREPWFRLTRLPADLEEMNDTNRSGIERWIESQRRAWIEPADLWERIGCPVLVQIGTRDRLVPPGPSRDVISAALARAGNGRAEVKLYEGGDHALFESPTGYMSDIPKVKRLSPHYLTDLRSWIARRVTGPRAPRGKGCGTSRSERAGTG
jgi:pimeloyl-ACP methyl ester carboxylesterase